MLFFLASAFATNLYMPLEGWLTGADGAPSVGVHDIHVTLYADAALTTPVHTETVTTAISEGRFAISLGQSPTLDDGIFASHADLWLSVSLDGGAASAALRLGRAPFAAHALRATDAANLGGQPPSAYTYTAGTGVDLTGNTFDVDVTEIPAIGANTAAISALQGALDGHTTSLGTLTTTVGGLNTTVGGLNTTVGGLNTTVGGLNTTVGGLNTTVAAHTASINGLAGLRLELVTGTTPTTVSTAYTLKSSGGDKLIGAFCRINSSNGNPHRSIIGTAVVGASGSIPYSVTTRQSDSTIYLYAHDPAHLNQAFKCTLLFEP
jgi:hypothetical protein